MPIRIPSYEGLPVPERVLARISKPDGEHGCWLWTGRTDPAGYSRVEVAGRTVVVHRLLYTDAVGPVPEGLDLDHLCRVRHCVNPAHLEAVTHLENCRRGNAGRHLRERTHCPSGHPYEGEGSNVYVGPHGRACRYCNNEASARYRQRRRERAAA